MTRACHQRSRRSSPGFTLLELCIVLFIMMLLAGVATPAVHSALVEKALRDDEGRVAQLVRAAMQSSSEQQESYVLSLDGRTLRLKSLAAGAAGETADAVTLDHPLRLPRADAAGRWDPTSSGRWQFDPDGLCPLPRLRLETGDAYLEMSFNALTGDVEDEATSLP